MLAGVRPQRTAEEGQRPVPRQLRPDRVELGPGNTARTYRCLISERMMRKEAMNLNIDLGSPQLALQCINRFSREERILRGPVTEHGRRDLRRVDVFERRETVPHRAGRYVRDMTQGQKR